MDAAMFNLALAAGGLPVVVGAVALTTRALVYRQTEPGRGREYLEWFRAQKAAEHDEAVRRDADLLSAAAEQMRPTQQAWLEQRRRRPNVTAQRATEQSASR